MSRTQDSLNGSRSERSKLMQRFEGVVMESILIHNRSDKAIDYSVDRRYKDLKVNREAFLDEYLSKTGDLDMIADVDEFKDQFRSAFEGSRGGGKSLSRFSQNVGRLTVKFYSEEGNKVVDPFAGHNSRMELVFKSNRHYYGQDLCHEFMEDNRKVRDVLIEERRQKSLFLGGEIPVIELNEGDSRKLPWPDNFGDFTITSPPYWFLEDYGPESGQLGKAGDGSYIDFLRGMYEVAKENFRVLKSGAFCVWFINDFRVDGKIYDYHGDTKDLLVKAGFEYHDIIIVDLGPSLRSVFLNAAFKIRVLPKRHEYGIVVKKP